MPPYATFMTCAPRQMQSVGNAARSAALQEVDLERIPLGVDGVVVRAEDRAVPRGIDVTTADEQQTVERIEQLVGFRPFAGRQDRGARSGSAERIEIRRRHAVSTLGPAGDAARFQAIRGDGDQGAIGHVDVGASLPQNRASAWSASLNRSAASA